MRFHTYFRRQKGSASTDPLLGVDTEPTIATGMPAQALTNLVSAKVVGVGNAIQRVAIGYRFSAGSGVDLVAKLWAFDRASSMWFMAATGALKDGILTYLQVPYLADPPQTSQNLGSPTSGGAEYLLTVADPGAGATTGVYHFVVGADIAQY